MADAHYPHSSVPSSLAKRRLASSRLARSALIALLGTLLLTGIELGLAWLLNQPPLPAGSSSQRLAALITLPLHLPVIWLIPAAEVVTIAAGTFTLIQPLALLAYARAAARAQERYRTRYTPLSALTAMYTIPAVYYKYTPDPASPRQAQDMALAELMTSMQDSSLLLLGLAGAGKSLALHYCQYVLLQRRSAMRRGQAKIPIYLPLTYYSLYLKTELRGRRPVGAAGDGQEQNAPAAQTAQAGTLLAYLTTCDLPGISYLRPYLKKLFEQGRLLLLCDGLDEVDHLYRATIATELTQLLLATSNRFVITCRELDLRQQHMLVTLLDEGHMERALLKPLQLPQVRQFVEQYIADQQGPRQYTAGQIMQCIERSRLRHLCTSPFMLLALLETIDIVGSERSEQFATRGLLLQEYILRLLERTQKQPAHPGNSEIIQTLATIACAARRSHDPYALDCSNPLHREQGVRHSSAMAAALLAWWGEQDTSNSSAPAPLASDPPTLARILDSALSAGLIEYSARGILSFRHAFIADYLVAEYFANDVTSEQTLVTALTGDLLEAVDAWSDPVALWAGLLDSPLQLADWFVKAGGGVPGRAVQAMVLGLICVGVVWAPPQVGLKQEDALPAHLPGALSELVGNADSGESLAQYCVLCGEEGVQEIYYALLSLLMVEGIEEYMPLLSETIVPELLFTYLCAIVDLAAYDAQVKRLCRILMQFGEIAVARAEELSSPQPARSLRLRAAAINILGGTRSASAVRPLLRGLADQEQLILGRSSLALQRLGPEITLLPILRELENRAPGPFTRQVHEALLTILMLYLEEKDPRRRLSLHHYGRILESAIAVLGANYTFEVETQQLVQRGLVRLLLDRGSLAAMRTEETPAASAPASGEVVLQKLFGLLIKHLSSTDEVLLRNVTQVLQQAGHAATPYLLEHVRHAGPEIVRARLVAILRYGNDPRSLPDLLRLIADPSPLLQQQVLQAMHSYSPASIPGLIDLLLTDPDERVAERAAAFLGELGAEVVAPLIQALRPRAGSRTRLLVQVAERLHDRRTLPALVNLLRSTEADALLTIAVIRALSQFASREVVTPILEALDSPQAQIYEEAIDALSSLGSVALEGLLAALDAQQETVATPRVRRALLGMQPFPAEDLVQALARASNVQARQTMHVLRIQGADAAHVLVQHLFDENLRVRRYVRQTLNEMAGAVAVPALLEVLNRATWRSDVGELLLGYPEAISPLVNLLGDPERAEAAFAILPRFGSAVLTPLIVGLADARPEVQTIAQNILVVLVQQEPGALSQVVRLFSSSLPLRAHAALMEVLTNDLAAGSISALLDGLEDAYLVEDVSEALLRLARKADRQKNVLDGLLASLRREERRRGAEIALIKLEALAVRRVGELITDPDQQVARAAQQIMLEIGAPALPFIWAAHSDVGNRAHRDTAMLIFHSMPGEAIKDALVELLRSEQAEQLAMAQALLLERISAEVTQTQANHEMIPLLLEYVQIHERDVASLRILALLMLLGGEAVVNHLVATLYDHPEHHEQLIHTFLFLGAEARAALLQILDDPRASARLRGEAVSMLGLLGPVQEVYERAQFLNSYGLEANRATGSDELTIALRALGSLLASGDWDIATLRNLQRLSLEESAENELYQVLLGRRYGPEISRMQRELQKERDARKSEVMSLTARIVQDHEHIHELEEQLEQTRHEHGQRGDELFQVTQERENYRNNLDKMRKEREVFRSSLEQALQMQQALQAEVTQLQDYNALLQQQLKQLRTSR